MSGRPPTSLALLTHDDCSQHSNGPGHPESPGRLAAVRARLDADLVAAGRAEWQEAPLAVDADLELVHPAAYLAMLARIDAAGGGVLDPDTALGKGSLVAARRAAGAAVLAARRALAGRGPSFCATRPPGHHATPTRAMGFCVLSNAAIAASAALREGADRVLIVDWDVHHGNGTADAVRHEARIRYVSLHQWPYYPGTGLADDTGCGNLFHVPRPPGLAPEVYLRDLLEAVDRAVRGFAPSLVIHSAGFDALRGDPLGGFTLEPEHYAELTRAITERSNAAPRLGLLEGGYDPPRLAAAAAQHAAALVS
jgi:acetoin utilization deacetylase AcuC-like enzyme